MHLIKSLVKFQNMEHIVASKDTELAPIIKHEMDDSFKADASRESGVFSNNESSETDPWAIETKGEVLDRSVFDPPINSTAINDVRNSCSISAIELDGSALFGPNINSSQAQGLFGQGKIDIIIGCQNLWSE